MGANVILFMVAVSSLVLVGTTATGYGNTEQADQVFKVAGKVLCQDCSEGWNEWINAGKPIKGSKVSVTCLDDKRGRVLQYESDLTDDAGYFEVTCKKYVNGKKVNPKKCFLRLVSSPDPVCNILTDSAGGKSGVQLQRPNVMYRDTVKYELGSFYYTTPMCDEPDTNTPVEEDNSDDQTNTYAPDGDDSDDGKHNNYY